MAPVREATLKALEGVLASSHEAQRTLRRTDATYRRFRRRIEQGSTVSEAFAGLDIPKIRQELADHLSALEHARHEARREVIALGVSEGLSLGKLARLWGVSRQLITRLANEKTITTR